MIIPVVVGLGANLWFDPPSIHVAEALFWIAVVATIELLPVPVFQRIQLSLGFPVLLAVGILYSPVAAAAVAFLGSFDPRELRREIAPTKSLFNRSQLALCHFLGSTAFHAVGSVHSSLYQLVPSTLLATIVIYGVNVALVALATNLLYGLPLKTIFREITVGSVREFGMNYLGLGFAALVIARLFLVPDVGILAVAAFILPLVFARQMFFRTMALEVAHKELKDRGEVLRALSNRMAEERQDERMRIAAYLHDDLAQMLFRLNLQAEMAKKRLAQGDTDAVIRDIDGILSTKQDTSNAIRALIRDLHRSPIGRKGLAEALQSFAEDMSKGPTRVVTDVVEVPLPPPIQLLIYQISREATMNALKHAEAEEIRITLSEVEDGVALTIHDNGAGFDTNGPQPEGHFGAVMMRERALVAGGSYVLRSEVGKGTTITATFPKVWVEEGSKLDADGAGEGESPGSPPTRPPIGTGVGPQPMIPLPEGGRNIRSISQAEPQLDEPEAPEARPA